MKEIIVDTKKLEEVMRKVDEKKRSLRELEQFFEHLLDPTNLSGSVKIESWSPTRQGETHQRSERFMVNSASKEFRAQVRQLLEEFRASREKELKQEIELMTKFGQSVLEK